MEAMPSKRRSNRDSLAGSQRGMLRAFEEVLQSVPPPPGMNIAPKAPKPASTSSSSGLSLEERYRKLRRRVKKRLAERYIEDPEGREKYVKGSIHVVIGKYMIRGDMLDWDHELRNIHAKLDPKMRMRMLTYLAKKLKVRTT